MFREKYKDYLSLIHTDIVSREACQKAFDEAENLFDKTHYLMTKPNPPSMASGGDVGAQFRKTAYTFRRFTHNYLLSLHNSFKGPDGKFALDVMARSLAYLAILGGGAGAALPRRPHQFLGEILRDAPLIQYAEDHARDRRAGDGEDGHGGIPL